MFVLILEESSIGYRETKLIGAITEFPDVKWYVRNITDGTWLVFGEPSFDEEERAWVWRGQGNRFSEYTIKAYNVNDIENRTTNLFELKRNIPMIREEQWDVE